MQAVLVSATSASCASALAVQASKQLVQPREQLYRVASVFKHASPWLAAPRGCGKARRTTFADDLAHSHRAPPSFVKR